MIQTESLLEYKFYNQHFQYSLFFQDYFKTVRNIDNRYPLREHGEYTYFNSYVCGSVPIGKTIIDVGANSGLFCVPLCKYGFNVIGFEPVKSNLDCLQMCIQVNNLSNLKLYPYALYNENITKDIFVPGSPDNASLNEVVAISNVKDKTHHSETIECRRLDDIIESDKIQNIGLVKSDVQGFEYPVLQGMEKLMRDTKDLSIIVEWDKHHTEMSGYSLDLISKILSDNNFKEVKWMGSAANPGNKIFRKL